MTPELATTAFGDLNTREVVRNLILTGLLWALAFGARALILSAVRSRHLPPAEVRRTVASTRTAVLSVLAIGTAALWFDELKTFALSLAAVAAAIVLATKEIILCVSGTFVRTSSNAFEIGDRIECNGVRGDVIDITLLTTKILEIGPGHLAHQQTGRAIVIPNSLFVTHPVVNESFTEAFVLHTFPVIVERSRALATEEILLRAMEVECAAYADDARTHYERMARERGIEAPSLEPRVQLHVDGPATVTMLCRLPVPARRKGPIEQAVTRRFLETQAA